MFNFCVLFRSAGIVLIATFREVRGVQGRKTTQVRALNDRAQDINGLEATVSQCIANGCLLRLG